MASDGPGHFKLVQELRKTTAFTAERAEGLAAAIYGAVTNDIATTQDVELRP